MICIVSGANHIVQSWFTREESGMSHPKHWAIAAGDRAALIDAGSGDTISYAKLDALANAIAHGLRRRGLQRGDGIALMMVNELMLLPIAWAAQRSGLFFTPISW